MDHVERASRGATVFAILSGMFGLSGAHPGSATGVAAPGP